MVSEYAVGFPSLGKKLYKPPTLSKKHPAYSFFQQP